MTYLGYTQPGVESADSNDSRHLIPHILKKKEHAIYEATMGN